MARTVDLGSMAPGLNNRLEPSRLQKKSREAGSTTFLHAADNVDLNADGYLKRRRGMSSAIAGAAHSIWADGAAGFVVVGGVLEQLADGGATLQRSVVRSNMPNLPLSYSRGGDGHVYWSNSQVIRRVVDGQDRPITAEPLASVPPIAIVAGALAKGRYLVAFTRRNADGESPASPVVQVDVPANGGLSITAGEAIDVYMSAPDGDVLTRQLGGAIGAVAIVTHTDNGRRCATLNRALMPAGAIVRHYNGSMLVASGNTLFISDPYYYGVYDPSKGYIPFPAPVTVVEPTANGVYVCADKTYWIADLLGQDRLLERLPYGGIPGTSGSSPEANTVFWQSPRGLVVGDDSGAVKAVQEGALAFSNASTGASLFRERDGAKHIVSTRYGVETSVAQASSFMEAEIVRKGTVL